METSAGLDGNLCVYEVAHTYLPVKYLSTTASQLPGCMATSADSSLLATVSRSESSPTVSKSSSCPIGIKMHHCNLQHTKLDDSYTNAGMATSADSSLLPSILRLESSPTVSALLSCTLTLCLHDAQAMRQRPRSLETSSYHLPSLLPSCVRLQSVLLTCIKRLPSSRRG